MNSLGPGRSPRKTIPDNTPTTGTGNEDSELTATGSVRAMVNQAQCASVPAKKMLYRTANHAVPDMVASVCSGCESKNGTTNSPTTFTLR